MAAIAPAVEDSRAALCQALLDRERLAMAMEDRDSFLAQRFFTGSMQLRLYVRQVSELPQTWQALYEVRDGNHEQALNALRDVRAANLARDSERIAEIVATELGSSSDEEMAAEEAEEMSAEEAEEEAQEADAILEEEPASTIVPFTGTGYRLGD